MPKIKKIVIDKSDEWKRRSIEFDYTSRRWNTKDWARLPTDEQLVEAARANVALYGMVVPPPEAQFHILEHTCPQCHEVKPVLTEFGVVVEKGVVRRQSWCRTCRGSKNARPGRYGIEKIPKLPKFAEKLSPEERAELLRLVRAAEGDEE